MTEYYVRQDGAVRAGYRPRPNKWPPAHSWTERIDDKWCAVVVMCEITYRGCYYRASTFVLFQGCEGARWEREDAATKALLDKIVKEYDGLIPYIRPALWLEQS